MRITLLVYNFLKSAILIFFGIVEYQSLQSGLEYRYQYMLLLYILLPVVLFFGVIELILLKKVLKKHTLLYIFPFLTSLLVWLSIIEFGGLDQEQVSWNLIAVLGIGVFLVLIKCYRLMKWREDLME